MEMLRGQHRADAVIVGGGLTGLLLGAALTDAGMQIAILDGCEGASTHCAGQATLLWPWGYATIEAAYGLETARCHIQALSTQLAALTAASLPYVRQNDVYAYARQEADLPLLHRQLDRLHQAGVPVALAPDAGGCPFPVAQSMLLHNQALVDVPHWLACLKASILRRGGWIFPDSAVIALDDSHVQTNKGRINAAHIILTAGKPLGLACKRLTGLLETRLLLRCNLMSGYALHCTQLDINGAFSLCPSGMNAAAIGDGGRMGKRSQARQIMLFQDFIARFLPDWLPASLESGPEIISADGLPVIGQLPGTRLLCACSYGGQGILNAMNAASLLTRRLLGRVRPEDHLYAPGRKLPTHLLRQSQRLRNRLRTDSFLHPRSPVCSHCRGRLNYCVPVRRWGCPFCGTAYSMWGEVLWGPGLLPADLSIRQRPDL